MTRGIVIDASAAIALVRREPAAPEVARALRASTSAERLVPDVFWLEIGNVLHRRYRVSPETMVEALRELDELGLESVRLDRALLLVAFDLTAQHRLSTYDAAYLALADIEDAQLLTLDAELAAAAGPRAIRVMPGPHRLAEPPPKYGAEPIDWARFGPYLAQLRAAARTPAGR